MGTDVDWILVFINSPIIRHLSKYETLVLSSTNKLIRIKLYSIIFNDLNINYKLLKHHSNYFEREKYYQFDNLSYIKKLRIFGKYGFNKDLAFKKVQIDPYIKEARKTLNSYSVHCKSLSLKGLERSGYYIFSIFINFDSLNKLSLQWCDIPYIEFVNLLKKLENLMILEMLYVNLILNINGIPNSPYQLKFPKSLKELAYININIGFSTLPESKPREFIFLIERRYPKVDLDLKPQLLPNLKSLVFYNKNHVDLALEEFINLNLTLEYISEPSNWSYKGLEDSWRN
jgi:hypothetical protein